MGNFCGGGSGNQQTTTSTQTPPASVLAAYNADINRATSVANTPWQPYTGEQVAPLTNQTLSGLGGINQYANAAQPQIQQGEALTGASYGTGAASWNPASAATTNAMNMGTGANFGANVNQYLNPATQDVLNTTEQQFNNQNQQQAQFLNSANISSGAFGGDRAGIGQAVLANQQQTAEDPVIAGIEQANYNQAMQQLDTQQQARLAGAGQLANIGTTEANNLLQSGAQMGGLGIAGQTAGLQGAQAQTQAGMIPQAEQQAVDTAAQNLYSQGQSYPFTTTGWLSNIIEGLGGGQGGTSTTSAPGPNQAAQGVGLGLSALGALGSFLPFSDERLKENIEPIGETYDGQQIYRYNFKGDHRTQIGLLAQEELHHRPGAVHSAGDGPLHLDYHHATEDAAERGHFQGGGAPQGASPAQALMFGGVRGASLGALGPGYGLDIGTDQHPDPGGVSLDPHWMTAPMTPHLPPVMGAARGGSIFRPGRADGGTLPSGGAGPMDFVDPNTIEAIVSGVEPGEYIPAGYSNPDPMALSNSLYGSGENNLATYEEAQGVNVNAGANNPKTGMAPWALNSINWQNLGANPEFGNAEWSLTSPTSLSEAGEPGGLFPSPIVPGNAASGTNAFIGATGGTPTQPSVPTTPSTPAPAGPPVQNTPKWNPQSQRAPLQQVAVYRPGNSSGTDDGSYISGNVIQHTLASGGRAGYEDGGAPSYYTPTTGNARGATYHPAVEATLPSAIAIARHIARARAATPAHRAPLPPPRPADAAPLHDRPPFGTGPYAPPDEPLHDRPPVGAGPYAPGDTVTDPQVPYRGFGKAPTAPPAPPAPPRLTPEAFSRDLVPRGGAPGPTYLDDLPPDPIGNALLGIGKRATPLGRAITAGRQILRPTPAETGTLPPNQFPQITGGSGITRQGNIVHLPGPDTSGDPLGQWEGEGGVAPREDPSEGLYPPYLAHWRGGRASFDAGGGASTGPYDAPNDDPSSPSMSNADFARALMGEMHSESPQDLSWIDNLVPKGGYDLGSPNMGRTGIDPRARAQAPAAPAANPRFGVTNFMGGNPITYADFSHLFGGNPAPAPQTEAAVHPAIAMARHLARTRARPAGLPRRAVISPSAGPGPIDPSIIARGGVPAGNYADPPGPTNLPPDPTSYQGGGGVMGSSPVPNSAEQGTGLGSFASTKPSAGFGDLFGRRGFQYGGGQSGPYDNSQMPDINREILASAQMLSSHGGSGLPQPPQPAQQPQGGGSGGGTLGDLSKQIQNLSSQWSKKPASSSSSSSAPASSSYSFNGTAPASSSASAPAANVTVSQETDPTSVAYDETMAPDYADSYRGGWRRR